MTPTGTQPKRRKRHHLRCWPKSDASRWRRFKRVWCGLEPKSKRIKREGGKYSVTDGPFIEVKELMGGFAIIRAKSVEEAVEWAKRFRAIIGDGESEVVRVFGPEDFGQ